MAGDGTHSGSGADISFDSRKMAKVSSSYCSKPGVSICARAGLVGSCRDEARAIPAALASGAGAGLGSEPPTRPIPASTPLMAVRRNAMISAATRSPAPLLESPERSVVPAPCCPWGSPPRWRNRCAVLAAAERADATVSP